MTKVGMVTQTIDEWSAEAKSRFGEAKNIKFQCPKCGNIQSVQDFLDRDLNPNLAYKDCLGRHDSSVDCDWAAYGLLGTLGKGRIVITDDEKEMEIFDFAEVS